MKETFRKMTVASFVIFMFLGVVCLGMWGCPQYNLYKSKMDGRSDSVRAIGVAAANRIISQSLDDRFLSYYFMSTMKTSKNQTIYVPSGNLGLPIPEATRLSQQNENQPSK